MATTIFYTIRGERPNVTSRMEVKVPDTVTVPNAILFAQGLAPLIDAVIRGAIVGIGLSVDVSLPGGLDATASIGADVEEGATFQFNTDGGFKTRFRIPTFDEALIVADSNVVDTADTDVAALVTAMEDGLDIDPGAGTTLIQPSDARDDDIVTLDYAVESFVSSRS